MATVGIPNVRHVRMIRHAISPRLATSTFWMTFSNVGNSVIMDDEESGRILDDGRSLCSGEAAHTVRGDDCHQDRHRAVFEENMEAADLIVFPTLTSPVTFML